MKCRNCQSLNLHEFVDLGFAPPSNAYLSKEDLKKPEIYYPLKVVVCSDCWLVQTEDYLKSDDIFKSDYAYFSSTSSSWLSHAATFSKNIIDTLNLNEKSMVLEIASNDGYLLKNFVNAKIPCLGIEPTESTASEAVRNGVPTKQIFFSEKNAMKLVSDGFMADLVVGNNVYAHVSEINDFTRGLKKILKPNGVVTLEFPHLLELIKNTQFDTIYHEHFSYLSLSTVVKIFNTAGLTIFDVEKISTHGGSLRIYGKHSKKSLNSSSRVNNIISEEIVYGIYNIETYASFQLKTYKIRNAFVNFLHTQKNNNKNIAGYGAAAKGNTLLNFSGVKTDLIDSIFDANTNKQNKYLPGSHIPILHPNEMLNTQIDFIVIFPWNIKKEIVNYLDNFLPYRASYVTVIPTLEFL